MLGREFDGLVRKGEPAGGPVVVLQSQTYTSLFKLAVDRIPSKTLGVMIGERRALGNGGQVQERNTIREVVPVNLVRTARGFELDEDSRANIVAQLNRPDNSGSEAPQIVGFFYADPGIGMLRPGTRFQDLANTITQEVHLLLLVNPLTNEGAFYTIHDSHWEPVGGFYEDILDRNSKKGRRTKNKATLDIIPWHSDVRNATEWLDALVGDAPEPEANSQQAFVSPATARLGDSPSGSPTVDLTSVRALRTSQLANQWPDSGGTANSSWAGNPLIRVALLVIVLVVLGILLFGLRIVDSTNLAAETVGPTSTPLSQAGGPTNVPGVAAAITPSIASPPTPVPPISTPVPSRVLPTNTAPFAPTIVTGSHEFRFEEQDFEGGYRPAGNLYRDRTALLLHAGGGQESAAAVTFNLNLEAGGPTNGATLTFSGLDSADAVKAIVRISVNNVIVYEGADPLANELLTTPAVSANWATHSWQIPVTAFRQGRNTLTITNLSTSVRGSTQPFIVFDYASISW